MNRLTFAVFITLIVFLKQGECGVKPVAKFDSINTCISCEIDIAPLNIKSMRGYEVVTSDDCYQSTQVGKPELPVRSFFVLLPPNAEIKDVTITHIDQIKLDGEYNIKPVSPPIPILDGPKTEDQKPNFVSEDFYPEKILKVNSIQKLRGYTIACLSVFGAGYNPKTKELFWNKQINFNLNLTTSKIKTISTTFRRIKEDEELVKEIVINPELTYSYSVRMRPLEVTATYTYCIITSKSLVEPFNLLLNKEGFTGTIATTQWINTTYQGSDTQEKIKAFIKDYYSRYHTRYVLLGGDIDIVPYRGVYAKVPEGSDLGDYIDFNIPCDLYYACLDGDWDWDTDGNRIYGELGTDTIDLMPEVFIGRAPVSNLSEATNFVNKVISHNKNSYDDYIYKELLIAYKLDTKSDGKKIMEEITTNTPATYTIRKEYQSDGGGYKSDVINRLNSGVGLVGHAGHGTYNSLQSIPSYITITDIRGLVNDTKTFIFNTISCDAGDFSKTDCIGEEMLLNQNGGAVAFVGNSRYGWYEEGMPQKYSGEYQIEFFKKFFKEGYTSIGETLGRSKMSFIPECGTHTPYRWIMFCLNLLGDPTMEFYAAEEIFCIEHTIDEVIKPEKIINLVVTLKNLKDGTMTGISGRLSTTDVYMTIIDGTATFGDISSKGTSTNSSNPYQIMVKPNSPAHHKVNFSLEISADGGYKYVDKFDVVINIGIETLDKVMHYPNPCYPDEGDVLKIVNIPLNSNPKVYIYNLAGELVRTLDDEFQQYPGSEFAIWDAKNEEGKDVAFGVYIYVLKCNLGTKKGKIAIIR